MIILIIVSKCSHIFIRIQDDPANWTLDDNGFPILFEKPRERVGTVTSIQSNRKFDTSFRYRMSCFIRLK